MDAKEVFQNMRPDARIIEVFDRDLAFLGTRIHLIKFLDGHLQPGEVVLDSTGHVVDGKLLEDADSMVRHDIMGAMTEEWSGSDWVIVPDKIDNLASPGLMPTVGIAPCCPGLGVFAWGRPEPTVIVMRVLGL